MKKLLSNCSLCIFSALLITGCQQKSEPKVDYPRPVKVSQVDIADGKITRVIKAEVQAAEYAVLSFRVPGQLEQVKVRAGDKVKQGDVLAVLDPATYQQDVKVAEAQYELARVLFSRSEQLVKDNFISLNDFDEIKSSYISAKSFLETQQNRLNYTQLHAPYDGFISTSYVENYQFVADKQGVFGFQGEKNVDVLFQLPEQYIGMIQQYVTQERTHQVKVSVRFSGQENWNDATVKELNTVADSSTGSYSITATLPQPDNFNALEGMAAEARIELPTKRNSVVKIPEAALLSEKGNQYLFIRLPEKNIVEKREVKVENSILQSGIKDGEWIVTSGADELEDGKKVVQWVKERGL